MNPNLNTQPSLQKNMTYLERDGKEAFLCDQHDCL